MDSPGPKRKKRWVEKEGELSQNLGDFSTIKDKQGPSTRADEAHQAKQDGEPVTVMQLCDNLRSSEQVVSFARFLPHPVIRDGVLYLLLQ